MDERRAGETNSTINEHWFQDTIWQCDNVYNSTASVRKTACASSFYPALKPNVTQKQETGAYTHLSRTRWPCGLGCEIKKKPPPIVVFLRYWLLFRCQKKKTPPPLVSLFLRYWLLFRWSQHCRTVTWAHSPYSQQQQYDMESEESSGDD